MQAIYRSWSDPTGDFNKADATSSTAMETFCTKWCREELWPQAIGFNTCKRHKSKCCYPSKHAASFNNISLKGKILSLTNKKITNNKKMVFGA